jgi:hypothetical protein
MSKSILIEISKFWGNIFLVAKDKKHQADSFVIYRSDEDQCWVAHSLRTDQIGTGERMVDALADVLKAVYLVQDEALKDGSLAAYREAPKEIQDLAKKAKKLPTEIFDVAHMIAHGEWPKDWNPPEPKSRKSQAFKADIQEFVEV